jgi:hypothetical protein
MRRFTAIRHRVIVICLAFAAFANSGWVTAQQRQSLDIKSRAGDNGHPTLADLWDGRAEFVSDIQNTGLPMGESDTHVMQNGELWSYVHANSGSGVVDTCGAPATFPGCVVIYRSLDRGRSFQLYDKKCLIPCNRCPCVSEVDHSDQQQYPQVAFDNNGAYMVYEYRARTMMRRSKDGVTWSAPRILPGTGVRSQSHRPCLPAERVGPHPYARDNADCLLGGPPGLHVENGKVNVFVAMGQNPGHMACFSGFSAWYPERFKLCKANPLFNGAATYGDPAAAGAAANANFDFRTTSSAEIQKIGARYYMLYEGIRGPGPADVGDNQFGIGMARSSGTVIDGRWERYPNGPIVQNLPGNIGLGHTDLVVIDGQTFLYTSLEGYIRGRLVLQWKR